MFRGSVVTEGYVMEASLRLSVDSVGGMKATKKGDICSLAELGLQYLVLLVLALALVPAR